MRGIKGTVSLVTGAGSGIGRSIALRLSQEGSRVVVVGQYAYDLPSPFALVMKMLSFSPSSNDVVTLALFLSLLLQLVCVADKSVSGGNETVSAIQVSCGGYLTQKCIEQPIFCSVLLECLVSVANATFA
jgi:hypothetical protein